MDVLVIGAGPAGSHAAAGLARRGWQVAVVERDAEAGLNVCCTGIVGQPCMSLLQIPSELVYFRSCSATFHAPSGRSVRLTRPETVGYVVDRPGLDRLLARRAMAAGASYRFSTLVTGVEILPDRARLRVRAEGGDGILDARAVVVATGFGSRLPAALGMGKAPETVVAAQAPVDAPGLDEIKIYADQALAPGGFAWVAPTAEGRGWAGLIARRDHGRAMDALLGQLKAAGAIAGPRGPACYGALPIQPLSRTVGDRVLVVGEAAGQIKPTTGGGIFYGGLCADIAADVLAQALGAGDVSAEALSPYERRWRAQLGRELSVGYLAHGLWSRLRNDDVELLMRVGARAGIDELVRRSHRFSFDWHAPLLLQLAELLPAGAAPLMPAADAAHRG